MEETFVIIKAILLFDADWHHSHDENCPLCSHDMLSVVDVCRERVTFEHKWYIRVCDLELDQTANVQGH